MEVVGASGFEPPSSWSRTIESKIPKPSSWRHLRDLGQQKIPLRFTTIRNRQQYKVGKEREPLLKWRSASANASTRRAPALQGRELVPSPPSPAYVSIVSNQLGICFSFKANSKGLNLIHKCTVRAR